MKRKPLRVASLLREQPGMVFLDSASGAEGRRSWLLTHPERLVSGHIDRDWAQVVETLQDHAGEPGGLFGWVGFDGAFAFGLYDGALLHDHDDSQWYYQGRWPCTLDARHESRSPKLDFKPQVDRDAFIRSVQRAQDYIRAGDIYQVNLSHPFLAEWPEDADPFAFYQMLREVSPAPYAAYLDIAGTRVMSSSPECFLKMSGRSIETRPIKGTRPRFPQDARRDRLSSSELAASSKEQAELLMITDLERNDLGQVCEFGSVHVPLLASVESFAQVFHLVSTVRGTLRADVDHATAFRACFPGGSISGAPKKRALQIIEELEAHPRGLYTGAIGYFTFGGESQFSIAIRTAVQAGNRITFHTGAGIVADSVPELEYEETLHKAAGLLQAAHG